MRGERPLPVTGRHHNIVLIEGEMPRSFEVRCIACHNGEPHERCTAACHTTTWTPWGEAVALEIGELHLMYMANPSLLRFHELADRRHGLKR
jgi:hypothetical protein